jgi:hypothetical protein
MNYVLLCYQSPDTFVSREEGDPGERNAYRTEMRHYMKALKDAGVAVAGAGLQLPETATTLRVCNDRRLVQDGPYADTKEQLAGFFVIRAPDLNEALDWAARFPRRPGQVMEVRPALPAME